MHVSERFSNLPEYAFPRLRALLDPVAPSGAPLAMSLGEPKHAFPPFVAETLHRVVADFGKYPVNNGTPALAQAQADWVARRYGVTLDPEQNFLTLNGSREGLFNACLALCPAQKGGKRPVVLVPNPFYQVYAVAAAATDAELVFVPATKETGFLPDYQALAPDVLDRTSILYICSPSNPQGAVASRAYLAGLLALAEKHDFRIFADECYSEIYRDAPPTGMLSIVKEAVADPERVIVFHSLSKRSNLPGLRAGFAAGGAQSIAALQKLRAYAGAPVPDPLQAVAAEVWADEAHVVENRALYQEKYQAADAIFADVAGYTPPEAGFFLWLEVAADEAATLELWRRAGIRVLPGSYLARDTNEGNPGQRYIRVAMVAPKDDMCRGLQGIKEILFTGRQR